LLKVEGRPNFGAGVSAGLATKSQGNKHNGSRREEEC